MHFVMVFTHPAHGGPSMDMAEPNAFYMLAQRGDDSEPVRTDLADAAASDRVARLENASRAYEAKLPRQTTRSLGDYVFVLEAGPYYEANEDKYIQQLTKTLAQCRRRAGQLGGTGGLADGDLAARQAVRELDRRRVSRRRARGRQAGAECGARGRVRELSSGPHAVPLCASNPRSCCRRTRSARWAFARTIAASSRSVSPRAGWWGICALAVGPDTEHEGKPLSQDAVLWIQVKDMK